MDRRGKQGMLGVDHGAGLCFSDIVKRPLYGDRLHPSTNDGAAHRSESCLSCRSLSGAVSSVGTRGLVVSSGVSPLFMRRLNLKLWCVVYCRFA
ncbi:hypothetical protein BaRGS_00020118 [Batillaria attramentaria]|uniref:Uncharacterized protein n=1 Tax=Batillaria attramentaria TaxID=370345 RepID=A0ABD0KPE0_9CAEN